MAHGADVGRKPLGNTLERRRTGEPGEHRSGAGRVRRTGGPHLGCMNNLTMQESGLELTRPSAAGQVAATRRHSMTGPDADPAQDDAHEDHGQSAARGQSGQNAPHGRKVGSPECREANSADRTSHGDGVSPHPGSAVPTRPQPAGRPGSRDPPCALVGRSQVALTACAVARVKSVGVDSNPLRRCSECDIPERAVGRAP